MFRIWVQEFVMFDFKIAMAIRAILAIMTIMDIAIFNSFDIVEIGWQGPQPWSQRLGTINRKPIAIPSQG